jgi:hypothetical protein
MKKKRWKDKKVPLPRWTPFIDITDNLSSPYARELGLDAKAVLLASTGGLDARVFRNNRYQVIRSPFEDDKGNKYYCLSIKSVNNEALHDWRHFQRIKNELCGPEFEALEIYPAESRLVDTSNQYYLWVLPEGSRIPFGFKDRLVVESLNGSGNKQRPFDSDNRPVDLQSISDQDSKERLLQAQAELGKMEK